MTTEFGLTTMEKIKLMESFVSYTEAYLNYGTATILGGILSDSGFVFTKDTPDPVPVHQAQAREAALNLISTLRGMEFNTADINAITDDMKAVGEAARRLGQGQALVMIDKKE
ncbi:MAG: TAL effector repeat-containing protein [Enterococcus sp.]|nr:TAL effector repeat-containing protein [Enterococcus sp.]